MNSDPRRKGAALGVERARSSRSAAAPGCGKYGPPVRSESPRLPLPPGVHPPQRPQAEPAAPPTPTADPAQDEGTPPAPAP